MDKKELVTILSTDMSKAFDSLSHSLTLKQLDAYGFNSSSLELIRSFFDSRLKRVKINGDTSEWSIMERGCPQGPLGSAVASASMNFSMSERLLPHPPRLRSCFYVGKTPRALLLFKAPLGRARAAALLAGTADGRKPWQLRRYRRGTGASGEDGDE